MYSSQRHRQDYFRQQHNTVWYNRRKIAKTQPRKPGSLCLRGAIWLRQARRGIKTLACEVGKGEGTNTDTMHIMKIR